MLCHLNSALQQEEAELYKCIDYTKTLPVDFRHIKMSSIGFHSAVEFINKHRSRSTSPAVSIPDQKHNEEGEIRPETHEEDTSGNNTSRKRDTFTKFHASKKRRLSQTQLDLKKHKDRIQKVKSQNLLLDTEKHKLQMVVPELECLGRCDELESIELSSFHELTNDIVQDVCSSALRVYYDSKSLRDNKTVSDYIEKVFSSVPRHVFDLLDKQSKEKKDKAHVLKCTVLRANNLPAKQYTGTGDVYCIAGVVEKKNINSRASIRKLKEEGLVNQTWQSTVKLKTLDPDWKESFEISITDSHHHYLVIELWDCQKDQEGLAKFFHKEDHFIGRCTYLLHDIPANGEEKTLELMSKRLSGTVTIFLKIIGKTGDKDSQEMYLTHKQLLECIISSESKTDEGHVAHWNCQLPPEAEKLLVQHGLLHHIPPLQHAAIRLNILWKYHRVYRIEVNALNELLRMIRDHESGVHHSNESRLFWIHQLLKDLEEIRNHIINIMKSHLLFFNNFRTFKSISLLKDYLLLLHSLYQIKLIKVHLPKEEHDLKDVLTNAIQMAVPHWMILFTANKKHNHTSLESSLTDLKEICAHCLRQCERAFETVHPIFNGIGVDYFSPFYFSLQKILSGDAESRLKENVSSDTGLLTYVIYRTLQRIVNYSDQVNPVFLKKQKSSLSITKFHDWFEGYVSGWFHAARVSLKGRMDRIIQLDTVVETIDKAPFSSSAVDTHAIFLQIVSYWKEFNWPDRGQSLACLITVVESLCELITYYTQRIISKVKEKLDTGTFTDHDGGIIITNQLCVALNNVHHVSFVLKSVRDELDLERYYKWLDEEKQQDGLPLSERADNMITDLLKVAIEEMWNNIDHIIILLKTKLSPSVTGFIPKILRAPLNADPDQVIEPLIEYITDSVGKLGELLLAPMFLDILHHLWINIVESLFHSYDKIQHTSETRPLHIRLSFVLIHLSDFFEADGKGLNKRIIESEQYLALKNSLFYAVQSTEDIIKTFCSDLVRQQISSKNEFGHLHISHIYHQTEGVLSVEILMAENLPALDRNGKSDPFVQVLLLPPFVFSEANKRIHKTETQKETLNPFFNETINLTTNLGSLLKDGSILVLAVFDHDTFGRNDFAGLCALSCETIPVDHKGIEPKMEHLYLFHYEKTEAYKELELRHNADSLAHDFLKLMKKFAYDGQTHTGHPFHRLLHIH
ncbi:PREDICTED: protein unc-13 homolog D-like [Amphimedon queenslandica]|uniref:C2 domain-containing protein n=1 Tax=Amphimedon queenslandica TaxID=400682 RepID=A0A1X7UJD6_AMPQE|nr:PREDICTED: protein unc-13 homolog D-like [Amphimedon queenslandica]|eukprot:XP_019853732.1 PREDICTED: protein unc-13 homolog D-like [Amphimedon queenslandica]